jgi:hypothetical protein
VADDRLERAAESSELLPEALDDGIDDVAAAEALLPDVLRRVASFPGRARRDLRARLGHERRRGAAGEAVAFPWETSDLFLFSVHHHDRYRPATTALGPAASLAGRDLGQDFDPASEWACPWRRISLAAAKASSKGERHLRGPRVFCLDGGEHWH